MTTLIADNQESAPATASAEPKATTKASIAPRKPRVAPSKGKSAKKTTCAKKGAKGAKRAAVPKKDTGARQGSKTEKVLDLLKQPGGATLKELMKATGWQPHSVRGVLSGTVGKKMGLTVTSAKSEDGQRSYSVKACHWKMLADAARVTAPSPEACRLVISLLQARARVRMQLSKLRISTLVHDGELSQVVTDNSDESVP